MKSSRLILTAALLAGCGAPGPGSTAQSSATPIATATPAPRVRLIIPAGTRLPIEIQNTISSDSSREGDAIMAKLTEDVPLTGFTLDRGAEVTGRIFTSVPAKRVKGKARLVFGFESIMESGEKLTIETSPIDSVGRSTKSKDKKIIVGGAVGGLLLGALTDGKKGAAIGTAAGAAAGTGTVMVMKGHEVEFPRGAHLTVTVTR